MKKLAFLLLMVCNSSFAQIYIYPNSQNNNYYIQPQYSSNQFLYAQNQCRNSSNIQECMSKFGFNQIPNTQNFTQQNSSPTIVIPNKNTPDYLLKNACTPSNLSNCANNNYSVIIKK